MKENIIRIKAFYFSGEILELYLELKQKHREYIISGQLLRSGTSIGANIEEAMAAQSRKDFISKLSIASKESRETYYWLRLLKSKRVYNISYDSLLTHCEEVIKILTKIIHTTQQNP